MRMRAHVVMNEWIYHITSDAILPTQVRDYELHTCTSIMLHSELTHTLITPHIVLACSSDCP